VAVAVHVEASVARYEIVPQDDGLVMLAEFAESRLRFERRLRLWPNRTPVQTVGRSMGAGARQS
jgi:hypothetical protein